MDRLKQKIKKLNEYNHKNFCEVMDAIRESNPKRWADLYMECKCLGIDYKPAKPL